MSIFLLPCLRALNKLAKEINDDADIYPGQDFHN